MLEEDECKGRLFGTPLTLKGGHYGKSKNRSIKRTACGPG